MTTENHTSVSLEGPNASKANRRFYEVVIFLLALNRAHKHASGEKGNDLPHDLEQPQEQLFLNFLCRLGQICDSRPGGHTVTAFTVLQRTDNVEYVFASNKRTLPELESVKGYVGSILKSLRYISECDDDDQLQEFLSSLLRDILAFNRDRVKRYLIGMKAALGTCIEICGKEGSLQALGQQKVLRRILDCASLATETDIDDDEFLDRTECLIGALQKLQSSATAMFARKRAGDDKAGNPEPWREFRHHSSRLMSYKRSVDILWYSGDMWPELFTYFEVSPIPSSVPNPNPLMTSPQTASAILSRLVPVDSRAEYVGLVETIQRSFDLDKVIQEKWTKKTFKTIVHAEILVLSRLETDGDTRPERFFGGWRYIGGSKPTCKLCYYYISSHPSGIHFRSSHANLYENWRMPDSADVHGVRKRDEALQKRQEITQKVMGHLRQDIQRILKERVADTRPHDSATISTFTLHHHPIAGSRLSNSGDEPGSPNEEWVDTLVDGGGHKLAELFPDRGE